MSKIWHPVPLTNLIMEILRKTGPCTDEELMKNVKKERNDVNISTLNKALLQLEVRGLVQVSNSAKGRKNIQPLL